MVRLIAAKRDGAAHSREEYAFLANGAAEGSIPDYQLAAWLMAAYLQPLGDRETADLTMAMAESGERMDLSGLPKPWVDKHSTGGVGDKTTLVLLPLLAACGLTVVKMSGRGLGITGGTIDKLESVPGFRTDLSPEEMKAQAQEIGLALTGQTPRLAPADKALYALRDVTATVPSLPLIVSSILSKKIAGGAETVVLDVKCGSGAFMPDLGAATGLADALERVGTEAGLTVRTRITDMSQPLGSAVGNALEVKEAIRVLAGRSSGRFAELCLAMAATTLEACGHVAPHQEVERAMVSGASFEKAKQWFAAQGADLGVFDHEDWGGAARVVEVVYEGEPAFVAEVDARAVGQLVVDLGGGRKSKADIVDPAVGVELAVEVGAEVRPGDRVGTLHLGPGADEAGVRRDFLRAFRFSTRPVGRVPVVLR